MLLYPTKLTDPVSPIKSDIEMIRVVVPRLGKCQDKRFFYFREIIAS